MCSGVDPRSPEQVLRGLHEDPVEGLPAGDDCAGARSPVQEGGGRDDERQAPPADPDCPGCGWPLEDGYLAVQDLPAEVPRAAPRGSRFEGRIVCKRCAEGKVGGEDWPVGEGQCGAAKVACPCEQCESGRASACSTPSSTSSACTAPLPPSSGWITPPQARSPSPYSSPGVFAERSLRRSPAASVSLARAYREGLRADGTPHSPGSLCGAKCVHVGDSLSQLQRDHLTLALEGIAALSVPRGLHCEAGESLPQSAIGKWAWQPFDTDIGRFVLDRWHELQRNQIYRDLAAMERRVPRGDAYYKFADSVLARDC